MFPSEVSEVLALVEEQFSEQLHLKVRVLDSASWFHTEFKRCGDWDSWAYETAMGRDYSSREPHFSGFVVINETLGRANAQIVNLAIQRGSAVFLWQKNRPLTAITHVVTRDEQDWVSGWTVSAASME